MLGMMTQYLVLNEEYEMFSVTAGGIPDEIGCLTNLKELNLREGRFSGPLPGDLFNISTLEIIDLYRNEFCGHLPSSMGHWLPNLKSLVLNHNNFSGSRVYKKCIQACYNKLE